MGSRVLLIVLLAAILLVALPGCPQDRGNAALQQRVTELEQQNTALQSMVAELEQENAVLRQAPQISRQPKEGWEQYFPTAETTTLAGKTTAEIRELLGEPPVLIRSSAVVAEASREIWIYAARQEDPTGLYLFFKGDRLDESRLDEFNGLPNSGLLERPGFWN